MKIGKLLKESRERKKLTQQELADTFHVTRQTVSRWENEQSYPNLDTLVELSFFFDFSLDEILKGDDLEENKAIQKDE
ncbi:helix-turn-helix transcriptional regulator [Enterococcus crotali]|uniref:helix-turn-helix transcriptional regulator n=1 Tax=Enterococcus crotali TaxID=1453587 RepID=UPI00046EE883|nr:helix-turn-helix transcriptional regulator [Enterococcus crotali]